MFFEGQSQLVERDVVETSVFRDRKLSADIRFDNQLKTLAYSPDGRFIAASYNSRPSSGSGFAIWSGSTGRRLLDLKNNYQDLHLRPETGTRSGAMAFSSDSRYLASVIVLQESIDQAHLICVWDASSGEVQVVMHGGHKVEITDVEFTRNGQRIATSSLDGTVRIWDVKTGLEVLILDEHTGGVEGLGFSPDGWRLASANHDGTIRVWDARPVEGEPEPATHR